MVEKQQAPNGGFSKRHVSGMVKHLTTDEQRTRHDEIFAAYNKLFSNKQWADVLDGMRSIAEEDHMRVAERRVVLQSARLLSAPRPILPTQPSTRSDTVVSTEAEPAPEAASSTRRERWDIANRGPATPLTATPTGNAFAAGGFWESITPKTPVPETPKKANLVEYSPSVPSDHEARAVYDQVKSEVNAMARAIYANRDRATSNLITDSDDVPDSLITAKDMLRSAEVTLQYHQVELSTAINPQLPKVLQGLAHDERHIIHTYSVKQAPDLLDLDNWLKVDEHTLEFTTMLDVQREMLQIHRRRRKIKSSAIADHAVQQAWATRILEDAEHKYAADKEAMGGDSDEENDGYEYSNILMSIKSVGESPASDLANMSPPSTVPSVPSVISLPLTQQTTFESQRSSTGHVNSPGGGPSSTSPKHRHHHHHHHHHHHASFAAQMPSRKESPSPEKAPRSWRLRSRKSSNLAQQEKPSQQLRSKKSLLTLGKSPEQQPLQSPPFSPPPVPKPPPLARFLRSHKSSLALGVNVNVNAEPPPKYPLLIKPCSQTSFPPSLRLAQPSFPANLLRSPKSSPNLSQAPSVSRPESPPPHPLPPFPPISSFSHSRRPGTLLPPLAPKRVITYEQQQDVKAASPLSPEERAFRRMAASHTDLDVWAQQLKVMEDKRAENQEDPSIDVNRQHTLESINNAAPPPPRATASESETDKQDSSFLKRSNARRAPPKLPQLPDLPFRRAYAGSPPNAPPTVAWPGDEDGLKSPGGRVSLHDSVRRRQRVKAKGRMVEGEGEGEMEEQTKKEMPARQSMGENAYTTDLQDESHRNDRQKHTNMAAWLSSFYRRTADTDTDTDDVPLRPPSPSPSPQPFYDSRDTDDWSAPSALPATTWAPLHSHGGRLFETLDSRPHTPPDAASLRMPMPALFTTTLPPCGVELQVAFQNVVHRLRGLWLQHASTAVPPHTPLDIARLVKNALDFEMLTDPPGSLARKKTRRPWRRESVFRYEVSWAAWFVGEAEREEKAREDEVEGVRLGGMGMSRGFPCQVIRRVNRERVQGLWDKWYRDTREGVGRVQKRGDDEAVAQVEDGPGVDGEA
ncbi:hypothetical protein ACEQ8H_000288 [Pleosporales sp. CAS-2024a]